MNILLTKKFLRYFLIGFLVFMGVLVLQFISRYTDDIFNKGFPVKYLIELVCHTSLTFIGLSLLFGVLIASIFTFRYYSNIQTFRFLPKLTRGAILVIGISILLFAFNNWILPKSNLEMRTLLYDMRSTAPGEEIQHVDKNLFKNHEAMMTIQEINKKIDTFDIEIHKYRIKCDSLLGTLPDSIAEWNFNKFSLGDYGINFKFSKSDTFSERDIFFSKTYMSSYQNALKGNIENKQRYIKEKTARISLPIELILLYLIGASFGFIYKDQKPFLLVVLGLYTTSFFYGTINGMERLISQNLFGNIEATMASMLVLVIVTSIFLVKGLRKEQ